MAPAPSFQMMPTVTPWRRGASVRFLNAAYGYAAFRVHVGSGRFVSPLNYASVSSYGRFRPGYHTVTVSGLDGYIYIQKSMLLAGGETAPAVVAAHWVWQAKGVKLFFSI